MVKPKSQTNTNSFLISSSLVILAGLSTFISKLKETLHLTSDYIKTSLSKTDSSTTSALHASIIIMQNRKWAEDELRKIDITLKNITESEESAKQLEEKKIKLNSPTPNFKGMTGTLHKKQIQLADFIKQLDMFEIQQNKLNQDFLAKCDAFKQEIANIYKKSEIEFPEKEFGENASKIMQSMPGFEFIKAKELRKAVKHFGKKTVPGHIKDCKKLIDKLIEFINRAKKLFVNPSEIDTDLNAWKKNANQAIKNLTTETTTAVITPEKAAQ